MALQTSGLGVRLGPYELGERLGNGGMAEVYVGRRAGPHGFQKRFAIKRILPQLAVDARFVEMFCDEARICAALSHPNIVEVVDFGEHDGELFMAMEYVEGVSLARLLRLLAARGDRFPIGATLYIASEVLRGLEFAHEARDEGGRTLNIVHRDVSPGNILIGGAGEVKLTDFGIVLSAFVDRRTYPGELKGKMGYMSPEQVIGEELDARSDLFTLGIVLAEMLLARPLFPGKNELDMLTRMYEADLRVLGDHGKAIPEGLVRVLRIALARDREKRFQTARAFSDALRRLALDLGLVLNDRELVPWLLGLGVLPSASGTREASAGPVPVLVPRDVSAPPVPGRHPRPPSRERPVTDPKDEAPHRRPSPPRVEAVLPARAYRVRVQERAVGPLPLPEMLALIGTGRVGRHTLVSENGGAFVPLEQFPALRAVAKRPAFRFEDPRPAAVRWRREVSRATLISWLFDVVRRESTGMLLLRDGTHQRRVYFHQGSPYLVVSTDQSELLGARLVESGVLEADDVDQALVLAGESGQRLGEMLVATGRLRPTALLRALIEQLERRFRAIGSWRAGEMLFVDGERSETDRINAHLSGVSLVAQTLHAGYDDREIADLLRPLYSEPIARLAGEIDHGELCLSAAQRRALELAPGSRSLRRLVSELARDAGTHAEDTLRGVFTGLCAGLLVMPGWILD